MSDNSSLHTYDVCIVGAGASGLVSAIKIKDLAPEITVALIEKNQAPGRKVAAAGNGRCNLSNLECTDWKRTSAFFSSIGLITRVSSEGRIYPYSEDGRDVVRCLVNACRERGVEILTRRNVVSVTRGTHGFIVSTEFNKPKAYRLTEDDAPYDIGCKAVLVATGGKSKPELGSTGDGYRFAKALGHSIETLIPVLTGVETSEDIKALGLSGIRQKGRVSLYKSEELIFQDEGEVQFTDYGLSGIVILDLSRFLEGKDLSDYTISIDFAPEIAEGSIVSPFSIVKEPIARVILDKSVMSEAPAMQIKDFRLSPVGLRGWDMAQVTRGGVPLDEVDSATCGSLFVPGLYFSGEVLDVDYQCGGFNLQNAWTTGLLAGEGIAEYIRELRK